MNDLNWKSDLSPLLSPKSIALIGASENSAWSSALFHNLKELGYKGNLFPVNPKRETAFGLKCYPKVTDIAEPVDAFIIAI
jgi:acetate---CoA ligase (ADP-forming)